MEKQAISCNVISFESEGDILTEYFSQAAKALRQVHLLQQVTTASACAPPKPEIRR